MKDVLSALNFDIWTFVFMTINLLVVIGFLYMFLYKPVGKILSEREEKITGSLKKAAEDKAEAEALRTKYEEQITQAQAEAGGIINQAAKESRDAGVKTVREARAKANQILAQAKIDAATEKMQTMLAMEAEFVNLVIAAAGKVIEKELLVGDHDALVQEFVELHLVNKLKEYAGLINKKSSPVEAKVKTAITISKAEVHKLEVTLAQTIGRKVHLEHTVDPSVLGGAVVTIGDILIDGSMAARLLKLQENLIS